MDEFARRDAKGDWRQIAGAATLPGAGSTEVLKDRNKPELGTRTEVYDLVLPLGWEETWSPQDRKRFEIKKVAAPLDPPKGHRVLDRKIEDHKDAPRWVYVTEPSPLADREDGLIRAIANERADRNAKDFEFDFAKTPAVDDFGAEKPAGRRALQMRSEDRAAWSELHGQALAAVVTGDPERILPMRAADNWNVQTTAAQVLEVTAAMFARGQANLMHGGRLKSAVRAAVKAKDETAVDAIDITAAWDA